MPLMKVERIRGMKADTPRCVATVNVAERLTETRRRRERWQAERGLPVNQCGHYATHRLDGDPFCRAHAGQLALKYLEGKS